MALHILLFKCIGIISQEMGTHTMFAVVGSLLALITIVAYIMRRKYVPYL